MADILAYKNAACQPALAFILLFARQCQLLTPVKNGRVNMLIFTTFHDSTGI
jgi:hypothetical protein